MFLPGRSLYQAEPSTAGVKATCAALRRAEAFHYECGGVYAGGKIKHARRYTAPKSGNTFIAVCYTGSSTETTHFDSCSPLV